MPSAKKGAKGNKTAHVLNLLTAPGEAAPPAEEGAAVQEGAQPAPSRPLVPPILEVAQANDADLSQQIQQALEEELLPPAAPAPQPEPQPAPAPAPSGGKMSQDDIEKMLASMSAPEETPAPQPEPQPAPAPAPSSGKMSQDDIEKMLASMSAPEETPAPQPEPQPAPAPKPKPAPRPGPTSVPELSQEEKEDITFLNVMQILVEEKAPRYIKMFGLCPCKRCEADVMALTLSNLVPKYVVLPKLDRIPMLTVYEGRYNSTIFAQLTRSCKIVMDHPHHNR